MKIEIHSVTDENIKFTLHGCPISYANAIRRVLISEVPTIAIDLVEIERNNTALPDDVLAHRLGQIPMSSKKEIKFKEQCDCTDMCDECSIQMTLDVINDSQDERIVTCKDIKCDNDDIFIKSTPIIAKLGHNQSLRVVCVARKGIGRTHAKWSPVTAVSYEYDSENITRATNLWYEEDAETDWPMIKQGEADITKEVCTVNMDVEVVIGSAKPLDVLLKALNILKDKFTNLRGLIESYSV